MRNKILSLLVLLLTAASGAWATTDPNSVYWVNQTWIGWADSETTHTVGDITITCSGNAKAYQSTGSGEPLAMEAGNNDAITFTSNGQPFKSIKIQVDDNSDPGIAGWTWVSSEWTLEWSGTPSTSVTLSGCDIKADVITFTFGSAEPPLTVTWNAATKTGTFSMPGSDVELTPLYANEAAWSKVENVEQKPTAIEGIIAGTDAEIITAGQSAQGTVMYAVTTSAEAAPALTAFSATVPNAKDYDDAATLYVWYYIKGTDTPDGQEATAENTFNDSEICAEPLKVDILTNKFDLTLSPTKADKISVEVNGTAQTPTEGKLKNVKMESEVKLKANTGYKFRKVEVKKGEAGPLAAAFEDGAKFKVGYNWNHNTTYLEFTNSGGTYSITSGSGDSPEGFNSSTLTVNGNVLVLDFVCEPIPGEIFDEFCAQIEFDATSSTYKYLSKGEYFESIFSVSVNGTDVTSQLSEQK